VLEFVLYRPIRWLFRVWWRVVLHWLTPWREFHRFALYAEPHDRQSPLVRKVEDWWARPCRRRAGSTPGPCPRRSGTSRWSGS
jgi:hypothetical protein